MPNPWPLVPLGEVLSLAIDAVSVDPSASYPIAGVYSFGRGLLARAPLPGSQTTYKVFHRLHKDDFVLSQLKGWEGALARVTPPFDGWFLSPQFATFRAVHGRLDIAYLEWYCKQSKVWERLRATARGMGARRDSVSPERFLALEIPLPPLDEQRRIVARIEQLAAKIQEAHDLRGESSAQAAYLRTGALREIIETGSSAIRTLGRGILAVKNGLSRRPVGVESGPIVLRLADVSAGVVCLADPRRGSLSDEEIRNYSLSPGDLLFVRVNGSLDIVGRCIPFEGSDETVCFNDHLIRVRIDRDTFDWRYVSAITNGPFARDYIQGAAITTAGQFTINQSMLAGVPIPLVPLPEQRRIVAYLDGLQAKVDALKKLQAETAAELDALLPSILDKAFRGDL